MQLIRVRNLFYFQCSVKIRVYENFKFSFSLSICQHTKWSFLFHFIHREYFVRIFFSFNTKDTKTKDTSRFILFFIIIMALLSGRHPLYSTVTPLMFLLLFSLFSLNEWIIYLLYTGSPSVLTVFLPIIKFNCNFHLLG